MYQIIPSAMAIYVYVNAGMELNPHFFRCSGGREKRRSDDRVYHEEANMKQENIHHMQLMSFAGRKTRRQAPEEECRLTRSLRLHPLTHATTLSARSIFFFTLHPSKRAGSPGKTHFLNLGLRSG